MCPVLRESTVDTNSCPSTFINHFNGTFIIRNIRAIIGAYA